MSESAEKTFDASKLAETCAYFKDMYSARPSDGKKQIYDKLISIDPQESVVSEVSLYLMESKSPGTLYPYGIHIKITVVDKDSGSSEKCKFIRMGLPLKEKPNQVLLAVIIAVLLMAKKDNCKDDNLCKLQSLIETANKDRTITLW